MKYLKYLDHPRLVSGRVASDGEAAAIVGEEIGKVLVAEVADCLVVNSRLLARCIFAVPVLRTLLPLGGFL